MKTTPLHPLPEALQKLSRLYDVSGEYLLGLTGDMGSSGDGGAEAAESENMVGMADHKTSASKLISFIASSPSKFHAVYNICLSLQNEGLYRAFRVGALGAAKGREILCHKEPLLGDRL